LNVYSGFPHARWKLTNKAGGNSDGAMRALLRIIDREPKAALKALAA
jgi:hypothetical protein